MCYCERPEQELFKDLQQATVPDDALLRECCWRKICKVRGRWFQEIGDRAWSTVADRRAQLNAQKAH